MSDEGSGGVVRAEGYFESPSGVRLYREGDDCVMLWADEGGMPVELNSDEAREISARLLRLAEELDQLDRA